MFIDERFINKAQFDNGFAHHLILKDAAVPALKDPGHDSELQTVSEMASKSLFCWRSVLMCSSLFNSAHGTLPGARFNKEVQPTLSLNLNSELSYSEMGNSEFLVTEQLNCVSLLNFK